MLMSRVIAIVACGLILAACSMSMPGMDLFRSSPATEVLRIESEPPGADARTAEGQSCRTPCELTVNAAGEVAISFSLPGYSSQVVSVRAEAAPAASYAEGAPPPRMQPNPVYAELTPATTPRPKQKTPPKKKITARGETTDTLPPRVAQPQAQPQNLPDPATSYPSNYPWPPPPPSR
jgi:PEGA domain